MAQPKYFELLKQGAENGDPYLWDKEWEKEFSTFALSPPFSISFVSPFFKSFSHTLRYSFYDVFPGTERALIPVGVHFQMLSMKVFSTARRKSSALLKVTKICPKSNFQIQILKANDQALSLER